MDLKPTEIRRPGINQHASTSGVLRIANPLNFQEIERKHTVRLRGMRYSRKHLRTQKPKMSNCGFELLGCYGDFRAFNLNGCFGALFV